MVRRKRKPSEGDVYHVVSRGCGRQILFEDDADRKQYLDLLKENLAICDASLYAWCLMGNHVHLIVRSDLESLSELMRRLNSSYSMYFNKRHDRVGHLMQGRFKSEPIDSDSYLLTAVRYVHKNPEKAGMVAANGYPWSSFREYTEDKSAYKISDTTFVSNLFASREEFMEFHTEDDPSAPCIDIDRGRMCLSDDDAIVAANAVLDECTIESISALPKDERNTALRRLRAANLSVRQIERLTGISRSVISKVCSAQPEH